MRTVALNLSLLFVYFVELLKLYVSAHRTCLSVCLSDLAALNLSSDRNTLWS